MHSRLIIDYWLEGGRSGGGAKETMSCTPSTEQPTTINPEAFFPMIFSTRGKNRALGNGGRL